MSDNLKVAKECGAFVKYQLTSALGKVPAEEIFNVSELDDYTSRILASQQAAHDAEIAKLKEENARQHKEILVYHESRLALINEKEAMAKQLSASQAREAELREKLEAAEARGDAYSARAFKAEQEYQTILEHCRALEARIKASQEQEPAIHVGYSHAYAETIVRNTEEKMASAWCSRYDSYYSQPQIPPELAELQRRIVELEAQLRK